MNSRVLLGLLLLATIPQMAAVFALEEKIMFYNGYALIDGVFWAFLFYINCQNNRLRNTIATLAIIALIIAVIIVIPKGIQVHFRHELVCLNSLFQVLLVLLFFYEKYRGDVDGPLSGEPIFWFSMGLLLYAPTTYFLFVFYPQVTDRSDPQLAALWNMHHLLNASMYLIFSVGMYVNKWRTAH